MDISKGNLHSDKILHLQMIQNVISRMSTTSAIFKGFAATTVTGLFALSFTSSDVWMSILPIIPVFCFFIMDAYYFRLEKKYRILYEKIRNDVKCPDFSMNAECKRSEIIDNNVTWFNCIKSPCISWFYLPLLVTSSLTVVIKTIEVFK